MFKNDNFMIFCDDDERVKERWPFFLFHIQLFLSIWIIIVIFYYSWRLLMTFWCSFLELTKGKMFHRRRYGIFPVPFSFRNETDLGYRFTRYVVRELKSYKLPSLWKSNLEGCLCNSGAYVVSRNQFDKSPFREYRGLKTNAFGKQWIIVVSARIIINRVGVSMLVKIYVRCGDRLEISGDSLYHISLNYLFMTEIVQ